MELTIKLDSLKDALGHVGGAVERQTPMEIISHILLEAKAGGGLTITGNDTYLEMSQELQEANVKKPGRATLLHAPFAHLVGRLPSGSEMTLTLDEATRRVHLRCGRVSAKQASLDPDQFPSSMGRETFPSNLTFSAKLFHKLIGSLSHAMSSDTSRHYLNGVYLESEESSSLLYAVATDGHRLGRYTVPLGDKNKPDHPKIIIPKKTVLLLGSMLAPAQDGQELAIGLSESRINFRLGTRTLCSTLVDGRYPDFRRVIPGDGKYKMTFNKEAFLNAVERVLAYTSQRAPGVRLQVRDSSLQVSSSSDEQGEAQDEFPVAFEGPQAEYTVGYNGRFVQELLKQLPSEEGSFYWDDPSVPVVVKDGQDASLIYVLMPMRL